MDDNKTHLKRKKTATNMSSAVNQLTRSEQALYWYLGLYFLVNLLFLTAFPYVHSDESWLSGLSRHIAVTGDIGVTEPFFNIYQRYPHAIRLLFHLLQAGFMQLFGYQIFTFRLISLLFSVATLYFFYKLGRLFCRSAGTALLATLLLSLDLQYLYASHLARQEIIIVFILVLALYLLISRIDRHRYRDDLGLGIIVGLGIGVHPNILMVAVTIGLGYAYYLWQKKISWRNLALLVLVIGLFAVLFIGLSIAMDPDYLTHYTQQGQNFGVGDGLLGKWQGLLLFYQHLFNQFSIEYYMPNIRFQLLVFAAVVLLSLGLLLKHRSTPRDQPLRLPLLLIFGVNLGIFVIGRYNVTSVVFIFPLMYLLTVLLLESVYPDQMPNQRQASEKKRKKKWLPGLLVLITAVLTLTGLHPPANSYATYLSQIQTAIPGNPKILGNLNAEYAFADGQLLDYRNLQYLDDQGITFADYVAAEQIEVIIYYDELGLIIANHPRYEVMYGDLTPIAAEMTAFLAAHCEEITVFNDASYGTNLAPLIDARPWSIHIFRVTTAP
ncbi:ArnT family glycosyltransferase [Acetobacterium wieringae]|uniref:Dolichyl-phosphate-mannose-protein mannosyltransferase n=1 Tax=Acetobacterium wieringae TaxID=52694 RepID=A0A1F2PI87_9FIRM|nr:glycosyltransferase family 39 protein [Acetobacterium wieringae]OFV70441.1 dolichyl-phosphate-mannose-protein mannosyltransferase [Acetobacterium wieringae]